MKFRGMFEPGEPKVFKETMYDIEPGELGEPKEETLDRVDNKYHLAHDVNNNPSANFPSSGSGNIQFLNSTRAMCIALFIALCQSMCC